MNCDYCNYEIDDDSTVCPDCGRYSQIPEEITLTQCSAYIDMKLIRPGQLRVKQYDQNRERAPDKIITLSKPFYMGIYLVTQEQYENVMGENPSQYPERLAHRYGNKGILRKMKALTGVPLLCIDKNLLPVDSVSWEKAQEFCRKLSFAERRNFQVVHLPTEAQWEYACRAGSTTKYFFGDVEYAPPVYMHRQTIVNRSGSNSDDRGHAEVGSYKPNGWGLYDMHGNVGEWCEDDYTEDKNNMMPPDGTPFKKDNAERHVARGLGDSSDRHSGEDDCLNPASSIFGFRVCMSYRRDYIKPEEE